MVILRGGVHVVMLGDGHCDYATAPVVVSEEESNGSRSSPRFLLGGAHEDEDNAVDTAVDTAVDADEVVVEDVDDGDTADDDRHRKTTGMGEVEDYSGIVVLVPSDPDTRDAQRRVEESAPLSYHCHRQLCHTIVEKTFLTVT
jgi:hypothetical protein